MRYHVSWRKIDSEKHYFKLCEDFDEVFDTMLELRLRTGYELLAITPTGQNLLLVSDLKGLWEPHNGK